jgi:AraC-like DNA-binding protein
MMAEAARASPLRKRQKRLSRDEIGRPAAGTIGNGPARCPAPTERVQTDVQHPADTDAAATVSLAEIADTSRLVGERFATDNARLAREGAALRGKFRMIRLRPGMVVHTSDTVDLHDMTTAVEQQPGITIHLFLEGRVDASIGGRPLCLGRGPGEPVRGVITARAMPDAFERHGRKGAHVRKVNVTLSTGWLNEGAFGSSADSAAIRRFAANHLARFEWLASPGLVSLAEQMLHPPPHSPSMQTLYLESRALDLVGEAFAALTHGAEAGRRVALKPFDLRRLKLVESFLDGLDGDLPSLEEIARQGGVSVSTLRRLFMAAHGMTVFDYVRRRGLERARFALERQGASVSEAAYIAGYASPANFATAFKRAFGVTPTEIRRH